ncbi:MAG: FAD-dependent oxidoreductase [Bryobacteraceae bacterium]
MERDNPLAESGRAARGSACATRRRFLSAALVGLVPKTDRAIAGGFVDRSEEIGHKLRSRGPFRAPARSLRAPVVIVGAGMAGLCAAWRLEKRGFGEFVLLELEPEAGGVSRWGQNQISGFPWGAHYVPVPGARSLLIRELLADLGVLVDGRWEERHLCFSPQERLYLHGRWQEGLEPELGATERDHAQYRRFEERIREFRASGAFTVPMEGGHPLQGGPPLEGGPLPASALDRMSFADWLRRQGFDSPYLRWYANYACRDDYGALAEETSAWAGIHYFAAREPEEKGPLTWPEGNGWIVRRLSERLRGRVRTGSAVYRIEPLERDRRGALRVLTEDTEYLAEAVIFAAPTFLAPYVLESAPAVSEFEYSPWLTANLVLDRPPRQRGAEPAWDNVIYDSPALGYVVATHQMLGAWRPDRDVWTFYWALAQGPAARNRKLLLAADWNYWKEAILNDLARAHSDIRQCVSRIDVMRMGHAMARPRVGFLSSEQRRRAAASNGPLYFGHSDLSGFSIIEEAQYRGVAAADGALQRLGGRR